MLKKIIIMVVVSLLIANIGFAAGGKEEVVINVILDDRGGHRTLAEKVPEFEEMTGIKVNVELLPETEMKNKINIDLMSRAETYDIIMLDFMIEVSYIQAGMLEPLDDYMANRIDPNLGFEEYLPERGAWADDIHVWEGKRYALPLWAVDIQPTLMYRADLFAENGITLSDPPTIYEVEQAAAQLTDKSNGQYGWAMRGIRGQNSWMFLPVAEMFGARVIDLDTYEPLVNSPKMVEALEWYSMMDQEYGPPDVVNYGWYECMESFATGKVAMIQDSPVLSYYGLDVEGQILQGKIGQTIMAQIPGQPISTGVYAWGMAMTSSSEHKDEAWKFMQWALSEPNAIEFQWGTTFNTIRANFDKVQMYPGEKPNFSVVAENAENASAKIYNFRYIPEGAEIMDIISAAISSSLSGELSAQDALDKAYKELYGLLESKGYY